MASNRNSKGFSNPDTINPRDEAASARDYSGAGVVRGSNYVGKPLPSDDRMHGILGKPLASGNTTLTARASVNSSADTVTALGRAKLNEIGAATANVRDMIKRKR